MKIKNNSTDNLIKMSEDIYAEITRDILDICGIDLSHQKLSHHDKTKPVWTQQIRDNEFLKQELDLFLNIVKNNVMRLPEMIEFEKEHPSTIVENFSHDSISYDLEFLWICESHVAKFEKENYMSQKDITKYKIRIQELRDRIKDITIGESLLN